MSDVSSEFRPTLDTYNGPLDLLLYLIKKDEVDIFDIPIANVVGQYRRYLEILQSVDPNNCGDFLVVAANLMEIKSKLLLPREMLSEDGQELEDPRLELVQQLLEYKKYKERALLLERRFGEFSRRQHRPTISIAEPAPETSGPVDLGNVTVWDLLTAFHRIQMALGHRGPVRVVMRDRPLEEYVAMVEAALSQAPDRTALFDDLFVEAPDRVEAIGVLLALLEMGKAHQIELLQESFADGIQVRLRTAEEMARFHEAEEAEAKTTADPAETFLLQGEGPAEGDVAQRVSPDDSSS
jgi:segregation and condensation protein A